MEILKAILEESYAKKNRDKITFLTGAGVSSDSGIPTYRGSDGIWVKGTKHYKPEIFGTFEHFQINPEEVWQYTLFRKNILEEATPNESHNSIARIETLLDDRFQLITQNVDNLHRRAGSKNLFEIHGNYREVKCSGSCSEIYPFPTSVANKSINENLKLEEIQQLKCPNCGSWLRPNILWFDEQYDERTNKKYSSLKIAKNTSVLIIVGTSGATSLPIEIAKTTLKFGGYVIDLNIEDNHFTELLHGKKRKLILRQKSSDALIKIEKLIQEMSD